MRLMLPHDWQVPALFSARLGDSAGRQRAIAADGHLLLVLHEVPRPAESERAGRLFWRDPEGAWRSKPLGDGLQALRQHVVDFANRVEELEKQWQTAGTAEDYYTLLRVIAPLHRTVRNLHAALQQARELVAEDRDIINLRDQVGEIERTIELLHGDAKNGLDFTVAYQAEQQTERSHDMAVAAHRLNLMAATLLPIATVSGIYGAIFGMILAHREHKDHEWSTPELFWSILGLGLVSGFALAKVITRKPAPIAKPAVKAKAKRR